MNDSAHTVSLSRLEELAVKAETLRGFLRAAFLDDAPRLEVNIFRGLLQLLQEWLPSVPSFSSPSTTTTTTGNPHDAIERFYLQEVVAALLLLADESCLRESAVSVAVMPKLVVFSERSSEFYVDVHIRRYCAELLLYICFSRICRTQCLVQALYPLLLESNEDKKAVSQNHISDAGLFAPPRFREKKMFVSGLLNGVMLSIPDGVRAVLRVLLLDDRVEHGMAVDAAKHIACLFTSSIRHAWLLQRQDSVVSHVKALPLEEHVRLLSAQLVDLMVCHAEVSATRVEEQHLTAFLRQRHELREANLTRPETLEERLHLCMTIILNTALHLNSRRDGEVAFAHSYKRFCLFNRHLLTPAFRALTLRCAVAVGSDEVLLALRRLTALAKGSTLGPSPRALLLTLEAVSPALLDLFVLTENLPPSYLDVLQCLLEALWWMEVQFEQLAHIFVRGVFLSVRGSFTVDRVAAMVSVDLQLVSSSARRMRGLRNLILQETTPRDLIYKVLQAAAAECMRRAASASVVGERKSREMAFLYKEEELHEMEGEMSEEIMLASLVETICVGLSAEEVFGSHATLDCVCDVLATVATISLACWRWATLLIPRVLTADMIHLVLTQHATATERKKAARVLLSQLERLTAVVATVGDAFSTADVSMVLAAAVTTVQHYEGAVDDADKDEEDSSLAELHSIVRAAEGCLDSQSVASLVVHLLSLSRTAEEFASRTRKWGQPAGLKDYMVVVHSAMWLCVRVLAEVDDVCAAVAACKSMMWWSLARADSVDSSFLGRLVVEILGVDANTPSALRSIMPCATASVSPSQMSRLKVRLLDVLLGLCDYDTDGRTLRNVDDYCKTERKCTLFDVLTGLCGPQNDAVVQVATLHLVGHFVLATYPRVSLATTCGLCVDVFRHTVHEMAKAACASMLSHVAGSLEETGDVIAALSDVDVAQLRNMAEALRHYRSPPGGDVSHAEVIRHHGRHIMDMLQQQQHQLLQLVQEM